ncbi:MAG TPA: MBL fold metallo-hydrolase [Burkholderiaceae bacterium]|nr:MBL fold metallo-hydrolase [Burkholderiaceae bacterium]
MKLQFLGGAGTVTGSRFLVEHAGERLLVDCGLFQGLKQLRLRNWAPFPVPPSSIDAVLLTHAHLDHSGYLPRLVDGGFRGKVHCTTATLDLCKLLLPDSARLLEDEAGYANRHGFSKHSPALPLYTEDSARRALRLFDTHAFDKPFSPLGGLQATFRPAGHILGAASIHLAAGSEAILFSGDLGRSNDLVMKPPAPPMAADTVLIESTYGNRLHDEADPLDALADVIARTAARGGKVIVPAFAVGRAQTLLYAAALLKHTRRIPDVPIYLNSPMAASATEIMRRHGAQHKLTADDCRMLDDSVRIVTSDSESRALNALTEPAVIISASGMATGGRVLHHLKAYAPDSRSAIVFAGFQAAGTRGASMIHGAREIKIHGGWVPVRAEVVDIGSLSSHADRNELLAWLGALPRPPRHVYVTHGEPEAADSLRQAIEEKFGWECSVPEQLEVAR